LLPKKKTSSGFEFVSGLAAGASAMPAKWSRRVFSFRFYEGKLAVEQPTKFELVINLKAAKAHIFADPGSPALRYVWSSFGL
jgi:hypothetical protein